VSDSTKMGWLTSILELGAWLGTLYSGFLAEIFSRKHAILINVTVFIIGVVIQTIAITPAGHSAILGGRFITGMGVGSLSMIVPMYNAEIAPPEVRGALIGLQQLSIVTGIMISFWIDYGTVSAVVQYRTDCADSGIELHWWDRELTERDGVAFASLSAISPSCPAWGRYDLYAIQSQVAGPS